MIKYSSSNEKKTGDTPSATLNIRLYILNSRTMCLHLYHRCHPPFPHPTKTGEKKKEINVLLLLALK